MGTSSCWGEEGQPGARKDARRAVAADMVLAALFDGAEDSPSVVGEVPNVGGVELPASMTRPESASSLCASAAEASSWSCQANILCGRRRGGGAEDGDGGLEGAEQGVNAVLRLSRLAREMDARVGGKQGAAKVAFAWSRSLFFSRGGFCSFTRPIHHLRTARWTFSRR